MKIEIHGMKGFLPTERKKFREAMSLLSVVLDSAAFQTGCTGMLGLVETRGYTNHDIYDLILDGADKFQDAPDGDIDVHIEMYYSRKSVIGYTYPSTYFTWINRRFFKKFDLADICGNVMHEYCHNLGFKHRNREARLNSVPYRVGYLVKHLASEMEGNDHG